MTDDDTVATVDAVRGQLRKRGESLQPTTPAEFGNLFEQVSPSLHDWLATWARR
jgi:hypothetical protein